MTRKPHDALFRYTFSRPEHAAGELRAVLPADLVARIDWRTLARQPDSFVDSHLADRASDVLFSVQLAGRETLLYVLFEHQSQRDRWTPLRLLRYQVRIWEQYLGKHPDARRLPPIIPVVLHHDPAGRPPSRRLAELIDVEPGLEPEWWASLAPFVPDFTFVLDDLAEVDDETLRRRSMSALARLALGCLRHSHDIGELVRHLGHWAALFREVYRAPHGVQAVAALLRYIQLVNEAVDDHELEQAVAAKLGPQFREIYMTTGERLIQKGLVEGERQLLLRQLQAHFADVDQAVVTRIQSASKDELERWAERILTADTIDDVIE